MIALIKLCIQIRWHPNTTVCYFLGPFAAHYIPSSLERFCMDVNAISYWALLRRNRPYRRLWLGLVVSNAGDWFRIVALYHLVLELTGASGLALGWVLIAQSLSMFLLSPVAGVLADRLNR